VREFGVLLPEVLLSATATVVLFIDLVLRTPSQRRLLLWTSLIGLVGAAGAIVRGSSPAVAFGGMYVRDGLCNTLQLLTIAVAAVGLLLSRDYLVRTDLERGEYYALVLFASVGAMLLSAAGDLLLVFLGLEILSVPLYVLAAFARGHRRSQEAGLKYFLLGSFASGVFLYGAALVYGHAATTALARLLAAGDGLLLRLGVGLVIVGLGYKAAAAPFHAWAPDVYEGAPMPAAAFMSVIAKLGAVGALVRLLPLSLSDLAALWRPFVAAMAALTMVVGNLAALGQVNLKRMLAYSSVAHAGYLLIGVASGTPTGITATVYYLAAYAAMQLGAFGVLVWLERLGMEADEVGDLAGLGGRSPVLAAAFALFMASLVGIPPTAGFFGKLYLFTAALEAGMVWLAVVGVLTTVVSVAYYLRAAYAAYTDPARPGVRLSGGPWLAAGVFTAAVGVVLLGILVGPATRWAQFASGIGR
jgi:NADH-quinone oxidoreductase subunit N